MEIWKDIPGYEGIYQISDCGRVKSISKGIILKPRVNRKGYLLVGLSKRNKREMVQVHRIIAHVFIPNPDNLPQVNHKDENKTNNHASNLEWCTNEYNCNYGTHNKRMAATLTNRMDLSKPVLQMLKDGRIIKKYPSIHQAARETGVNCGNIGVVCKGERKTAGGYIWRYYGDT